MDFAAQQAGQLAADRKPQSRAAIFAACARVGLLERFENDLLLLGWNSDTGVRDLEGDNALCLAEDRVCRGPADGRRENLELDAAPVGELESVRQQIFENLLQALESRW